MVYYRSTLILYSASASPWRADTVFGHLCWFLIRRYGEESLQAFLDQYDAGNIPLLVSDGCPGDYLPRPLLLPMLVPETLRKSERLQRQRRVKEQMHSTWLTLEDFNRVRRGEIPLHPGAIHDEPGVIARNVTPKNQIDRITNTAGSETGALYDMEELVLPKVTLYWLVANDHSNTVKEFLTDLCKSGYGKRKAVGYGQIASFTFELFSGFDDIPDANGFVSLSRFVPAPSDPTEGYWKTAVKYGKLGEELAYSENPFKRPLLMLECGSCLYDTPIGKRYGQLLSGLSVRPEVRDYAFAFPVPISLPVDK